MKIYRLVLSLVVVVVVGCATPATNLNSLRGDSSERLTFESNQPYQFVYQTILTNGKKCWNMTGVGMVVESEFSENERKAAVIFSIKEPVRIPMYYITADIIGMGDSKTSVSISHRGRDKAAIAIKDWVVNGTDHCS